MTEPHHAHLAEMRASRPDASATDPLATIADVPFRALTGAELRAELRAARDRYIDERKADRLRQCYPDPTRRCLVEMRMMREVRRG